MYQNLELHLDAAIDKVDNLAKDVEIRRMEKKWDEVYAKAHDGEERIEQSQVLPMVSEGKCEYGAEKFEAYRENHAEKVAQKYSTSDVVTKKEKHR